MSSNTPDIDTSNESGKDFGILNSLGIQISFGIACSLMLIVFIICFQFGMDYNLVREEMDARGRRLREERLAEAHSHHPEKRKLVIERKIARKKCSAQNIICTKKDESVDTGSTRSLDCCSSSSNASAGVVDAVREEDHHDEDPNNAENLCSVCLEPFLPGDEVAWSKDLKCQHCFHFDCLNPWLMKHGDCPVCRTEFLSKKDFMTSSRIVDDTISSDEAQAQDSIDEETGGDIESSSSFEIRNGQISFKNGLFESGQQYEGKSSFPIFTRHTLNLSHLEECSKEFEE